MIYKSPITFVSCATHEVEADSLQEAVDKTVTLKEYYQDTNNIGCFTVMGKIETVLLNIKHSDSFSENNIEDIYNEIKDLEEFNDRAIRLSCAEIY